MEVTKNKEDQNKSKETGKAEIDPAMYAQGMTVREIKRFLEEQYKVEVSVDLISTVTDSVMEDVIEWQNRPLEAMYPVVFFDALRVKIREDGSVEQGRLLGAGYRARWNQGCTWHLDSAD
jgi:putative transposase